MQRVRPFRGYSLDRYVDEDAERKVAVYCKPRDVRESVSNRLTLIRSGRLYTGQPFLLTPRSATEPCQILSSLGANCDSTKLGLAAALLLSYSAARYSIPRTRRPATNFIERLC